MADAEGIEADCVGAGEAGIVLSRFRGASFPTALRFGDETLGREFRGGIPPPLSLGFGVDLGTDLLVGLLIF